MRRLLVCLLGLFICGLAAWLPGRNGEQLGPAEGPWREVAKGVLVSRGLPAGYAIVRGDAAILLGASRGMDLPALKERGIQRVDLCLLTHHHRDTSARAEEFSKAGIKVRAPQSSANWLTAEGIERYWATSLQQLVPGKKPGLKDRTFGDWSYLVHARAPAGVTCDLVDGEKIRWQDLTIQVMATPGHSRDHTAFVVRRADAADQLSWCFCGDAFCSAGRLWSPYTTDWHHATDEGLVAASKSLRALAAIRPDIVFPEHGAPLSKNTVEALNDTAAAVDEAALLKSFERYTKERVKNPPDYAFLAKDQVATAGEKPWSRLSEHLFLTGNTYVLASRDGPILVIDPYHPLIGKQIETLQRDQKLGPIEAVLISHAHNDHYLGLYDLPPLPADKRYQVWTLDKVAEVIGAPTRFYSPYLDIRGVTVDRILQHGETVRWHEYTFRFRHAPGQTRFTMGFDVEIDGKRCCHTADNFFHADQFSGSGGWSGRNRGWPAGYSASARDVQGVHPDWILAEHGGPYVYSAEDYRRRIAWAEAAGRAADALSVSGKHLQDWNPTFVRVEPLVVEATPGGVARFDIVGDGGISRATELTVEINEIPGISAPVRTMLRLEPGAAVRQQIELKLPKNLARGRHIIPITIRDGQHELGADVFVVLETSSSPPSPPNSPSP